VHRRSCQPCRTRTQLLSATTDQRSGYSRSGEQAEVLFYVQDFSTTEGVTLQCLWHVCR